jgi:hypothetical protein
MTVHPANMRVFVWDEPHDIAVYRKSKSVWVATGDYMGKLIVVQDKSASTAAKRWREAAEYKGNIGVGEPHG